MYTNENKIIEKQQETVLKKLRQQNNAQKYRVLANRANVVFLGANKAFMFSDQL